LNGTGIEQASDCDSCYSEAQDLWSEAEDEDQILKETVESSREQITTPLYASMNVHQALEPQRPVCQSTPFLEIPSLQTFGPDPLSPRNPKRSIPPPKYTAPLQNSYDHQGRKVFKFQSPDISVALPKIIVTPR